MKMYNNFNEMFTANATTKTVSVNNRFYDCSTKYGCMLDGEFAFEVDDDKSKWPVFSICSKFEGEHFSSYDEQFVGDESFATIIIKTRPADKYSVDDYIAQFNKITSELGCKKIDGSPINFTIETNGKRIRIDCDGLLYGDGEAIAYSFDEWLNNN